MATTSPDNLFSPNPSNNYNLIADWATSMQSVQAALAKRGNLYVGTAAQRTAFSTAPEGTHWQDTDGPKYEWVRKAGVWRGLSPLSGSVILTPPSGGGVASQTVTFPAGYFDTPPFVTANPLSAAAPSTTIRANSNAVTATSADIVLARGNNVSTSVSWVAIPSV